MRQMSVLAALCAALFIVASSGCGVETSSSDSTQSSDVPLPTADSSEENVAKKRAFRGYYNELRSTGVTPTVARCYVQSAEETDPRITREILNGTASNATVVRTQKRVQKECQPDDGEAIEGNRSEAQLEKTRDLLKGAIRPSLESKGASEAQVECVLEGIDSLATSEFEEITTGDSSPAAEGIMEQIFESCGAS